MADVAAICDPFLKTWYPATPTLSVDAVQERLICDEETTEAERFVGTLGGVVSEGGGEEDGGGGVV